MSDGQRQRLRTAMLVFPNITQLDLTGPYEVLARLPGNDVSLVWKTRDPVRSEHGLTIVPDTTFAGCTGPLDILVVPGGSGINPLFEDDETLDFVRRAAAAARYVVGVCAGSLVLGAAGLLRGRRATTHWMSRDMLAGFGAETAAGERIVVDGAVFTSAGVTAGIDLALRVVAEIAGRAAAEAIQLGIEYAPEPPFTAGSPDTAPPEVLQQVLARAAPRQKDRAERAARAAAALSGA
jgi:cyclohexyl-isocyanide hydratase